VEKQKNRNMFTIGFDLDMTLVDSNLGLIKTLGHIFPEKYEIQEKWFVQKISGLPLKEILSTLAHEDEISMFEKLFLELYPSIGVSNSSLYPGAIAALNCVKDSGYEPIIVSAKSPSNLDKMVSYFELPVSLAVGGAHGLGKSKILKDNNAQLYVGDQESDVMSAHNVGIPALKIVSSDLEFEFTNADWTLEGIEKFPEWFPLWLRTQN
jgi:phosphoglycolate phosphatase-like HAD superfamily hydrolase